MKKLASLALCASLSVGCFADTAVIKPTMEASATDYVWATVPEIEVIVDKDSWILDVYNINGNNYFKLRDIAMAFTCSDTLHPFEVTWDAANNAINLISDTKYTPVGGECGGYNAVTGEGTPPDPSIKKPEKAAIPSSASVYLNGKKVNIQAYNIDGNNYFKLRDLAQALNFEVNWDPVYNMIYTSTYGPYNPS